MTVHDGSQRRWVPESELEEGWTVLDDAGARLAWCQEYVDEAVGLDAVMADQEADYDPEFVPTKTVSRRHAIAVVGLLALICWALIAVVVLAVAHAL
jgi:hypothetical protein